MAEVVQLKISSEDDTSIFIESTDANVKHSSVRQAGRSKEEKLDKLLEGVKPFCGNIMESLRTLVVKPDSATVEFGLSFNAEGNCFFVKAGGEASIKIALTWNNFK
jgi:hypothetical protein